MCHKWLEQKHTFEAKHVVHVVSVDLIFYLVFVARATLNGNIQAVKGFREHFHDFGKRENQRT